jgi:glycosyltransferase involved in cell wall biosynthesis
VVFAGSIREPDTVALLLELSKGALGWHGGFTLGYYTREQVQLEELPIGVAMHLQHVASPGDLERTIIASRVALWLGPKNAAQYAIERELFPLAATGTPLVARADTGAERFLIPNQEVITFTTPADLVHNVRALLDTPVKRSDLGQAAKSRINQKYPLSASVQRLNEALRAMLG